MKKKAWDIYTRNVKGYFSFAFGIPTTGGAVLAVYSVIFAPITLTVGAGLKTLIDYFTRKNIPEETIKGADNSVGNLDAEGIAPLISMITGNNRPAQSNSSRQLVERLYSIPSLVNRRIQADVSRKKRELQEEQLGIDKNPALRDMYRPSYILNLALDEAHQHQLEVYSVERREDAAANQLYQQKSAIKTYLAADHNYGKKTQQIICNYFFPPLASASPQESVGTNKCSPY